MRIVLAIVSVAAGAAAVTPAADLLAPRVVGHAVPTRLQDLTGYLTLSGTSTVASVLALPNDHDVGPLKELSALSIGAGIGVAALVYVLLGKVFS